MLDDEDDPRPGHPRLPPPSSSAARSRTLGLGSLCAAALMNGVAGDPRLRRKPCDRSYPRSLTSDLIAPLMRSGSDLNVGFLRTAICAAASPSAHRRVSKFAIASR